MTNDVSDIINSLELIHSCCETIEDCGGCRVCPLGRNCFEYNSLLDSFECISAREWQKFIDFADNVSDEMAEANMTLAEKRELDLLDYYDSVRKGERDEKYIEETCGR